MSKPMFYSGPTRFHSFWVEVDSQKYLIFENTFAKRASFGFYYVPFSFDGQFDSKTAVGPFLNDADAVLHIKHPERFEEGLSYVKKDGVSNLYS